MIPPPSISTEGRQEERHAVLSPSSQDNPLRLNYLDGLRGLAALYVVLYHIYRVLDFHQQWHRMPLSIRKLLSWIQYGHVSVGIFIVLSGYCLMLPIVRSSSDKVKGGLRTFVFRRARRLLPPYFAALVLSLALLGVNFLIQRKNGHIDAHLMAQFTQMSLLSHLFLLHNLSDRTAYTINPALWSVATEWQIYLFFPLLLLPLWRRTGITSAVAAGFVIGLVPLSLRPHALDQACPWYLGLFALGMAGALISLSDEPRMSRIRCGAPWSLLALASGAAAIALCWTVPNLDRVLWEFDTIVGLGTMSLLIVCTSRLMRGAGVGSSWTLRLLASRPAILLGSFSYSIYLIHYPLLDSAQFMASKLHIAAVAEVTLFLGLVLPATLVAAYAFHLLFERPFMPGRPRTERAAEAAAIVSPESRTL